MPEEGTVDQTASKPYTTRGEVVAGGGGRGLVDLLGSLKAERPEGRAKEHVEKRLREIQTRAEPDLAAKAGVTIGANVMIPWPLQPAEVLDFYMANPWLGAVGEVLADAISAADVDLSAREYTPDGRKIDGEASPDEYALGMAWLHREDFGVDGVSRVDFSGWARSASSAFDETGNLFAEILRNDAGDAPERLSLLLPQFCYYEYGGESGTRLLQIDPYSAQETRFLPFGQRGRGDKESREFLHERRSNRISSVYGIPPWITARDSVEVDNAHRKYLKGFFSNHAAPRYMVTVTQDPAWTGADPDVSEIDKVYGMVVDFLQANRGDMSGRNMILQVPGGIVVKIEPMDRQLEDPTFKDTASNARDEILAVRHVSLINLGLPEGGYRATATVQDETFRKQVLLPFSDPIVRLVNRVLHAPKPYGLGIQQWDLRLDFQSTAEVMAKLESLTKATGTPILTPDEGRDLAGYEKKGIDQIYAQAALAPLEETPPMQPGGQGQGQGQGQGAPIAPQGQQGAGPLDPTPDSPDTGAGGA
jgi:phage portal protein BeeE